MTGSKSSGPSPLNRWVVGPARKFWRELTSMRTALALLFLLAIAAIPGALLPQRDLNEGKTADYIADRGELGIWMDRVGLFNVFSSGWFTAIYLLLFISLVGCITPRVWEYVQALRTQPVRAPRNLKRLPRHITETVDGTPEELAQRVSANLRGWRRTTRTTDAGVVEVSAEKGYLREFGNLVFHLALVALLVTIAIGKLFGYEGTRTLVADDDQVLCNTSTAVYDSFRSGAMVDGTDLSPFCIKVDDFEATFLPNGQPDMYTSQVFYTTDVSAPENEWEHDTIKVNHPLRVAGDRVYVLGNGFAPTFTVTFPNGEKRTQTAPYLPQDTNTMLSDGAMRFDTPARMYPDEDERRKHQVAIDGLFAPDPTYHGTLLLSQSAIVDKPAVAVRVYVGDTGLDTGRAQSVYTLDRDLIEQGRLVRKASVNLDLGQSTTLPDGTVISFDGYKRWVSMQVSHDPAQNGVLISSIIMLLGLLVSLLVRRRRIWIRLTPASTGDVDAGGGQRRTVVEVAGLARTDQAGWGEGFDDQARALLVDGGRLKPGRL
ncbi:cytochrome c biogenesis protein ResB [Gordonia hirsuta DSM 44140 = NBRC 16056]|uniref:Cytochrome c biogenesis protein ResB n=1 Tax=Gordonia hirsuta DSM 44140 = NBRC 16056 TaxID=1121927 RepID=L7L6R9_9ACTN|nr:cytochrome c biogenesis protein ResB [Gordonia hirsuta]GAC56845.1 cytochrome c biogenesis protein ResB [Gordonia hirsuta DSM 44140 = NBRC 16056]